ncbi:MAG: hypothetical protein WC683_05770 [bacterium]
MAYQDLTTYTAVDPNGDLTVTSARVAVDTQVRNTIAYVAKDFGAGHFDDYAHEFEFAWDSASDIQGQTVLWGVTDAPGGLVGMTSGFGVTAYDNNDAPFVRLWEFVADVYSDLINLVSGTTYYARVVKSGTTATMSVFSNAARTTQVGVDRSLTVPDDGHRYLLAHASCDSTWNGTAVATCWSQNFELYEDEPGGATPWLYLPQNAKIIGSFQ